MGDEKNPPQDKGGASNRVGDPPSSADGSPIFDEATQRAELIARAKENTRRLQEQARVSFETRRLRKEARKAAPETAGHVLPLPVPPAGAASAAPASSPPTSDSSGGVESPPVEILDREAERAAMIAKAQETTRRIQEQAKGSFETRRLRRETRKVGEGTVPATGEAPLAAPGSVASDSPPDAPVRTPRGDRKRVLVVDDARPVRQILIFILQKAGYEVVEAASGGEAMIALRRWEIDLVLLDVMMHPIDGYAVLQQIRATPELKTLPVILLTARNQRDDILRAVREGANDFILKPFRNSALVAKVQTLLGDPVEASDA